MGHGILSRVRAKKEKNILVTGLYDSGKTTLMKKVTGDNVSLILPSFERIQFKNLIFTSWDVGGRDKVRPLYRHFYPIMDAIIYVVDSHNSDLFEWGAVTEQLRDILSEEDVQNLPLLVLANKQDLPGAMTCLEIREKLGLGQIGCERPVEILPISLVTGEGLPEVLDWLDRQRTRTELQNVVIQPLEKVVPPTVKSTYSKLSSALKQAFGLAKKRLPLVS